MKKMVCMFAFLLCISFASATEELQPPDAFFDALTEHLTTTAEKDLTTSHFEFSEDWYCSIADRETDRYILYVSYRQAADPLYGVYDATTREMVIPLEYNAIFMIPNGRYFIVDREGSEQICFEAEHNGTVLEPLNIKEEVVGVDRQGYVTLSREVLVPFSESLSAEKVLGTHYWYKQALLNSDYEMVLDFIDETPWQRVITFYNGRAIICTNANKWYGSAKTIDSNGKFGLINREGELISKQDFDTMFVGASERIYGKRGTQWYLINMNKSEVLVDRTHPSIPSAWAQGEINEANKEGLVPAYLLDSVGENIYRKEFCDLAITLYSKRMPNAVCPENAPVFLDAQLESIRFAAALGIVTGYEDGTFRPDNYISRQEAATMLGRLYRLLADISTTTQVETYQDDTQISAWARPNVYLMREINVMEGIENNRFSPDGSYTIEQAIATILRLSRSLN